MRTMWGVLIAGILFLGVAGIGYYWFVPQKLTTLSVAAGSKGSDSFTLMQEVSEVLVRHSTTVRLNIQESRNSSVSVAKINDGKIDLAVIQSNTPAYSKVNLVADLFPDYFLLITRNNSPIRTVQDVVSKRVAIPPDGSSGSLSFWSIIDHYRVAPESFRSFSRNRKMATQLFLTGKVDAMFFVSSLRDPFLLSIIDEAGQRRIPLRFIAINQADAMALKRPFLEPVKIVKGAFDGGIPLPRLDIVTASLNRVLVAGSDTDEEAVYELVKTIFENRLDLLIRMALSSAISDPRNGSSASLPIHPGATRFYDRDKPSFLQENAEPMALMATVFAMLISALLGLRRSLNNRAKNRGDVYNEQLLDISGRARDAARPTELHDLKVELDAVLTKMVSALDSDEVTEDGFRSFSFLWGYARDAITERQHQLNS